MREGFQGDPEQPPSDGRGFQVAGFSIRYPVTICMALLSFLVLGIVSLPRIPLVLFPSLNAPVIVVVIPYANSTPEQILESIVKPIEESLSTIPDVQRMTSRASSDMALVQLMFPWDREVEFLRAEVRERVEQVRKDLPGDVDRILVQNFNTDDIPIIEGRIASGRDLRGAYDFLDFKIKKPLERVPGVAEVRIEGVAGKEIDIFLRLDAVKRHRIDVGAFFGSLDAANLNTSLGKIDDGERRFRVLSDGSLESLEAIREFPVNDLGLTLEDIAEVEIYEPGLPSGRHLNGEFAISLAIRKASDANTVETVDRVMTTLEELNADPALEGIEVLVWHNAGKEIKKSLSGLLSAGLLGAVLSVGVLYLFLRRLGATLLIGLAIPFSILASVGFIFLMGKSLNVLSMMGLMLSTGMLVDNAVVVLESIFQQLEKGESRFQAARVGTQQVILAVSASTLTSIIIFVPLVFGKKTNLSIFLSETGVAIIITLLCSLFVSLTLIPLGAARFLRTIGQPGVSGDLGFPERVRDRYLSWVSWNLQHRLLMGLLIIPLILAGSIMVFRVFVPDQSPNARVLEDLFISFDFSENYHYARIERDFVGPVEAFLLENRDRFRIRDVYSYYANNEAETRVYFDEDRVSLTELGSIRDEIAGSLPVIPGARIQVARQEGADNENWMGVNVYGEDSTQLMDLADSIKRHLKRSGHFNEVNTEFERTRQEVQLVLNRERARRLGISPESVAGVLGIVLRGREVRGFQTVDGEVDIWVRLQPGDRENLADLESMVVGRAPGGRQILLSQVADLRISKTPGAVTRENRRTYTEVWANYPGDKEEVGKELMSEAIDQIDFPEGYRWSYGFFTQKDSQEEADFRFNILLALFMVYFVMASLFESLAHPFSIMFSLAFAFVGVTWFLLLTATPFNLMSMIGSLILIGIVVNNGIVLIDHINNLRRVGLSRSQAVREGCRERFRPILMTAATTIVGLTPLAVGDSSLFDLRYFPMARTLMGGLLASTVLTLVVLPTYYILVDDLGLQLRRLGGWVEREWRLAEL